MSSALPAQFADWEPFTQWCIRDESERFAKRLAAPMSEISAFYDAVAPRAKEAIEFCNGFALDAMPDEVVNLMHLLYSLVTVSFAVECWSQPRVPDVGSTYLDLVTTPGP